MNKTTSEKIRDLIPLFSTVLGVVSIILLWNLVGVIFSAISVTGVVVWLFQVFFTAAAIHLGLYQVVRKSAECFLSGFMNEVAY